MYSGELEVQAKRKALAVLQDEINRILNAGRVLSTLPNMLVKKDKAGIKSALEQIDAIEAEVENLRRKIKRCSRCWWFDFEQGQYSKYCIYNG